jgi:uncharacterized protein YjaG (DUF416 family)
MEKRCECVQVCLNNPDKNFEQLIEMGLICERCTNSYKEFCKIIEEEDKEQSPV